MNMMFFLLGVIMVPVFLMIMFTPYVTRKTESFGVSIPEAVYNDTSMKKLRKAYVTRTGIWSAVALLVFFLFGLVYGTNEQFVGILFSIMISGYIAGGFIIYLTFHRKMKDIKRSADWAKEKKEHVVIDTSFHTQKNTHSNGWFLFSFIIIGITLFVTFFQYGRIPDKIPMQFNFSGEVTNWAMKSMKSVLIMPVMQLYVLVLFVFINLMIGRVKQQISAENPEKSAEQNRVFRRRFSLFMIVNGTLLVLLLGIIQLSYIYPIDDKTLMYATIGISGLIVIAAIMLAFATGQGGSRVKVEKKDKNGDVIDRDDDRYWKLGQFYVNRRDPSMFLEKRFGVGWTVNFAHPFVWILFIGLIVVSAGIPLFLST